MWTLLPLHFRGGPRVASSLLQGVLPVPSLLPFLSSLPDSQLGILFQLPLHTHTPHTPLSQTLILAHCDSHWGPKMRSEELP